MTLKEQFEKETGISSDFIDSREEMFEYACKYTEWIEEKLTWKKFSEKKPDVGSHIIFSYGNYLSDTYFSERFGNELIEYWPEAKWMYVPE